MIVLDKSARERLLSVMLFCIMLIICGFPAENATAESILLAGSGSNLPATRLLVKEFNRLHPEIHFEAPTNIGSAGAIRAVADGAVSIGLISRPLLGDEKKLGLAVVSYARTAVVIGTNTLVKDDGITFKGLNSIYSGDKTTWKDGHKIIVLNREPGESSIYVLEENVPGFREIYADSIKTQRWSIILKDEGMNQKIETLPYSIGFSDVGAITSQNLKIKILKLNGIYPSTKTVMSGAYSLFKTLSFVYQPKRLTPEMKTYIAFVCSPGGHKVLLKNGYIPFCAPRQ